MIGLEAARERLGPLHDPVIEAHKAAVGKWQTLVAEVPVLALPLDATARANFIHCHLQAEVEPRIEGLAEVTDRLDFFGLKIGNEILLRFKFLNSGMPSNVPTGQQRLLARQTYTEEMTLALTGDLSLRPPTLLTCGHTLDGLDLNRIEIRRDCKGHLPWSYDIYGGDAVNLPVVLDGMADDARPATISSPSRKRDQEDEERADQE